MTDEQIALARRAVACRGWRWMPGMLTSDGFRLCRVDADGYRFGYLTEYNYAYSVIGDVLPDLEDFATMGCLLALVREAWGDPMMYVAGRGLWDVFTSHDVEIVQDQHTEAEALVAALKAAP